jgi:hypothetical protein
MCKYNYSNDRCANIYVDDFFCVGERNCSISDILRIRNDKENASIDQDLNDLLEIFPVRSWNLKSGSDKG